MSVPPGDEGMHAVGSHPQFNESMYFNAVDAGSGLSVLIRMGNRVNEGFAEVTVLVYLPGGAAAIHFERAAIRENAAFVAGGLRFDVRRPLEVAQVTYDGDVNLLARGTDLEDPKRALSESRVVPMRLRLEHVSLIPPYGLGDEGGGASGIVGGADAIAVGHYQVPCRVTGRILLDGAEHQVDALGFRDHSWGPRVWQGPRWWRWISCMCDDGTGFVAWLSRIGDEVTPGRGMVLWEGRFHLVDAIAITSEYGPPPHYPVRMTTRLTAGERSWTAHGEVLGTVPLRHRRDGTVARLAEVVCRQQFEGVEGHGIAEYHDLILDGVPAGMAEA